YFVRTGKETVQHLCRTVCVCLVQVELCPYKLCSVDFRFRCVSGVFFLSSCKHGRLCAVTSRFGTTGIASSGTPRMWSPGKNRWDVLFGCLLPSPGTLPLGWCSLQSVGMATGSQNLYSNPLQIPSQILIATSSLYFHCG
uniref:Uncharacterized protein n=1 Tax=Malurus cyaneus samueli TaxID=2593467 RepID=A0A8C5TPR9_9PASS